MLLCLPDDRGGTQISKVNRLDLEHSSVSAVEGIFTVLITGVLNSYTAPDIFIPFSLMLSQAIGRINCAVQHLAK